jgi:hypothetical protein
MLRRRKATAIGMEVEALGCSSEKVREGDDDWQTDGVGRRNSAATSLSKQARVRAFMRAWDKTGTRGKLKLDNCFIYNDLDMAERVGFEPDSTI